MLSSTAKKHFLGIQEHSCAYFDIAHPLFVKAARTMFLNSSIYENTVEEGDGKQFTTNVRPTCRLVAWMFVKTPMTLSSQPLGAGTLIEIITRSQWYVRGDVFGMYKRYIKNVLKDLETASGAKSRVHPDTYC